MAKKKKRKPAGKSSKPSAAPKKPAAKKKIEPKKELKDPKSVDLAEDLTEPVPHEAIVNPKIAKYLLIVVAILLVVVAILWFVVQNARTQQINNVQNQDKLQNVTPGQPESIQGGGNSSLQNSSSPQPSDSSGSQLQPAQSSTPSQVNQ
ncbi:hypothetical protein HYX70_01295 [Candidatus Saccharibacteria bacterium]|nr:hypothetical protein [Candidatus Saccharibacteria bacterium]